MEEYSASLAWLNSSSYKGNYFGSLPGPISAMISPLQNILSGNVNSPKPADGSPTAVSPNGTPGIDPGTGGAIQPAGQINPVGSNMNPSGTAGPPPSTGSPPSCLASPLVLDLGDDGIQPTSLEQGVQFNLMGIGLHRTAWIRGNDALLVLDRNHNNIIDNGTELFGDSTISAGELAEDGFAALALFDKSTNGGNGNGLIESQDLMYNELQLWTDSNQDGKSQPTELIKLSDAGVELIDLSSTKSTSQRDPYGNDLSLQGSFTRKNGQKGLVVDVLFRTAK
jgi:hypothetical protein